MMCLPPEILVEISTYLEHQRDFVACSQVSRSWHHAFNPRIYKDLKIYSDQEHFVVSTHRSPSMAALRKYGHHVQSLSVALLSQCIDAKDQQHCESYRIPMGQDRASWSVLCPNLESLSLIGERSPKSHSESRMNLTRHFDHPCPRLSTLHLRDWPFDDHELAKVLTWCNSKRLVMVKLENQIIGQDVLEVLRKMKDCPSGGGLKTLEIDYDDDYDQACLDHKAVRQILSCPSLVKYSCPRFDVDELFDPVGLTESTTTMTTTTTPSTHGLDSWSCKGLHSLDIGTVLWSRSSTRNQQAIQRLFDLKSLEQISIGWMFIEKHAPTDSFGGGGITRLLQKGTVARSRLQLDPDLSWISETWPKLWNFHYGPRKAPPCK